MPVTKCQFSVTKIQIEHISNVFFKVYWEKCLIGYAWLEMGQTHVQITKYMVTGIILTVYVECCTNDACYYIFGYLHMVGPISNQA